MFLWRNKKNISLLFVEEKNILSGAISPLFFSGPVNPSEFDRMIADSMKDLDDEEISDTEDPDLLVIHHYNHLCVK